MTEMVERILEAVGDRYGVTIAQIRGQGRRRDIVKARHMSIGMIRMITGMSFEQIGLVVDRDHTSASYAYHRCSYWAQLDPAFSAAFIEIRKKLVPEWPLPKTLHVAA
jgi:chromosomal replication initiator protein